MASDAPKWWKSVPDAALRAVNGQLICSVSRQASIYQIYPASFKDSNGDGVGDLPGILSKLDYVKSLGIDAIWISPFYQSPNKDQVRKAVSNRSNLVSNGHGVPKGYDISDYRKPNPEYGTLEDVEAIIRGCHDRGMRIIFDLVINHTSDQHRWFQESRKSKDNLYRKYYIWRPPRFTEKGERLPPSNITASFGGSAWEYDELTEEYYLHAFLPEQPDLNWEEPDVRQAIYDEAILFWLDKGIDGMRCDVINMISKRAFEDVPVTKCGVYQQPSDDFFPDGPRLIEFWKEMHDKTFWKYE